MDMARPIPAPAAAPEPEMPSAAVAAFAAASVLSLLPLVDCIAAVRPPAGSGEISCAVRRRVPRRDDAKAGVCVCGASGNEGCTLASRSLRWR